MAHPPVNVDTAAYPSGNPGQSDFSPGLTKREFFAATALSGLLANAYLGQKYVREEAAIAAISYADALVKALEQP